MVLCFNKYFKEWEELWNWLVRDNALKKVMSGNLNCMDPGLVGRSRGELSEIEEGGFNLVVAGSSVKLLSAGTGKKISKMNSGI